MSQHNIVGSEAFDRTPKMIIRKVRVSAFRRRRGRTLIAFAAGAGAVLMGLAAAVVAFGSNIAG